MQVNSRWSLVEELAENRVVVACECGRTKEIASENWDARIGLDHKCPFKHELIGETFGRLTVIAPLPERRRGNILFQCACECGQETQAIGSELRRGNVRSCGCLQREVASERAAQRFPRADHYVSYGYAHTLVKRERGSASEYNCACGQPAREWAYQGDDENEIMGKQTFTGARYSRDPWAYEPMCIPCHKALDHSDKSRKSISVEA